MSTFAERNERAIKAGDCCFGLRAFSGQDFRVCKEKSYPNPLTGETQYVVQVARDGEWLDFSRSGWDEMEREIIPPPFTERGIDASLSGSWVVDVVNDTIMYMVNITPSRICEVYGIAYDPERGTPNGASADYVEKKFANAVKNPAAWYCELDIPNRRRLIRLAAEAAKR